ncbi:hypothetical protein DPMN_176054 [Dreissena polymorpha]|uniref:Uncharacterized protein n=1 Tax=Dreissena polymorpha TaxID=45954 RepID=A0A9D4E7Q4_DREPO|nr:hypothetical protein DPMN_176054 [Dreissena polymorpha]
MLRIAVQYDSPGLWEALHGLHIKSLILAGVLSGLRVEHTESLSQTLSSLTQLESLSIRVDEDSIDLWGGGGFSMV